MEEHVLKYIQKITQDAAWVTGNRYGVKNIYRELPVGSPLIEKYKAILSGKGFHPYVLENECMNPNAAVVVDIPAGRYVVKYSGRE